ncbi:hypothetical protein SBRY_110246 [Actinacidiphila bryophytorum]|uniref:Uncharacterized protein n=1 Tax=Actinacidiphila bryophytorum TaxID=1436133 RepID=A0A9W4E5S6_9ACTN|nr:hypothetical protein SBRY_110246 [Actinacidiphila bryophytorum]
MGGAAEARDAGGESGRPGGGRAAGHRAVPDHRLDQLRVQRRRRRGRRLGAVAGAPHPARLPRAVRRRHRHARPVGQRRRHRRRHRSEPGLHDRPGLRPQPARRLRRQADPAADPVHLPLPARHDPRLPAGQGPAPA